MKILQVCPAYYPAIAIGGPVFSAMAFAGAAIECGHQVDVVATPLGLTPKQKETINYAHLEDGPHHVRIVYKRFFGHTHYTFAPSIVPWLMSHVGGYDLVVMHGIWGFPIMAGALAARWAGVPYLIFPHGTLYRETIELKSKALKKVALTTWVLDALRRASGVIFTSNDEADKVSEYLNVSFKQWIVPNIIPSTDFAELPPRGAFRRLHGIPDDVALILHYGRVAKKKGIEFVVEALASLGREIPDAVLAVVGGDEFGYRAGLERFVESAGMSNRVVFSGLVDRAAGLQAMADSDIFVLPSLSENFGMAVVEAMLCHLPVVISDHVGIATEVAGAGAGVVVRLARMEQDLPRVLSTLLRDPAERRRLGIAGHAFATSTYDIAAVKPRIAEMLESVMSTGGLS
ncbi:MAG: glycosyltransferase [Anaeromyxobacteraceae bacterium]